MTPSGTRSLHFALRFALLFALLFALSFGAAACDGTGGGTDGGGVDDGAVDAGPAAPPEIAWLDEPGAPVTFTPCPTGWREVTDEGVTTCDPYPDSGYQTCPAGEAHFAGEAACAPVGDPCPTGDYADTLPASGRILYVKAGSPPGGDGSLGAPYASLAQVSWPSLTVGSTVAIARGAYDGALPLRAGVSVIGACAAETRLVGVDAPVVAVVTAAGVGEPAVVRNVTIASAPQLGAIVQAGRSLTLDGVVVDGATGIGVVSVETGSVLTLHEVVVRASRDGGASAGRGVEAQLGGRIEADRVLVEGNHDIGVFVGSPGSLIALRDTVIRGTEGRVADRGAGSGIAVELGGRLEAERVLVEDNHDLGMLVSQDGTVAVLTDVVVRRTSPEVRSGIYGRGILVQMGARLDGTRVVVADNHEVGLWIGDSPTAVTLEDAVVRDTTRTSDTAGYGGRGVSVGFGGTLDATRLVVTRSREIGLEVHSASRVTLTDGLVRDTFVRDDDGDYGMGVFVQLGAQLEATRVVVERSHDIGLFASATDTVVTLTDTILRDTRGVDEDGTGGLGLSAQDGATVTATRLVVETSRGAGIAALSDAVIEATSTRVARVDPLDCSTTTCATVPLGYGVVSVNGGVRLTGFEISEAAQCGLMVAGDAGGAGIDLASGVVRGSPVGACVQVEGYDLARLMMGVQYRDNDSNLDATSLPVPDPTMPLDPFGR